MKSYHLLVSTTNKGKSIEWETLFMTTDFNAPQIAECVDEFLELGCNDTVFTLVESHPGEFYKPIS